MTMTDSYDSGFDLVLSDYERSMLTAHYRAGFLQEFMEDKEDDQWYGYQIGDRMFDFNIWRDDITQEIVCTVYECDWINDNWQTNCRHSWTLTEELD
jgi:hypothetical protein